MIDLDVKLRQAEFAALVGISQPAVSGLVARGIILSGMTGRQMLLAYCSHLRETAAGRASESEFDLVAERARLAKEQADRIALQNEVTRRELAPVHLIEQVLSQAGARVSGILEAIPGMLKRRLPTLSATDVELITREVAKARNIAAAVTLDDLGIEAPDEEEPA
ncbi:hypothetical protein CF68_33065 [Cupriavidus sp. SK-4]|uniref:terminase small subunit n=1 Tax=Cupriavidus sp. SK-4 TaxID=574750 RepID=UPI00044B4FA8|nr:terminase small subunit [Cupriavidus sp. SK-4]EYS89475.1 hypothetical protein CF68_33065 [Cupriavidus sp. SK-4]